jgi:hypothetical protein
MSLKLREFVQMCNELREGMEIPAELVPECPLTGLDGVAELELTSEHVILLFSFPSDPKYSYLLRHASDNGMGFLNYSVGANYFSYNLGTIMALGAVRLIIDFDYAVENMQRYNCICLIAQMARICDTPVCLIAQDTAKAKNSFLGMFANDGILTLQQFDAGLGKEASEASENEFTLPFRIGNEEEVVFDQVIVDWIGRGDRVLWLKNLILESVQKAKLRLDKEVRYYASINEDANPRVTSLSVQDKKSTKILWKI